MYYSTLQHTEPLIIGTYISVFYRNLNNNSKLVRFESKNAITIANIAHESSHIAMNIFDYIGAKVDLVNQETFSYLVGWVADCINQVRTGKFKD